MKPLPRKIEGEELRLEALGEGHAPALWAHIQADRQQLKRRGAWPAIGSEEQLAAYLRGCSLAPGAGQECAYGIFEGAALVGTLHVQEVSWQDRRAELGYSVHHAWEGQGVVAAALALLEAALAKHGFRELVIVCPVWNMRSWLVAERGGFTLKRVFHRGSECAGCDDCTREYGKALA